MKEPKPMKEVHEWRHKIYEEDKNLSPKERIEKTRRIAEEAAKRYGLNLKRKSMTFPHKPPLEKRLGDGFERFVHPVIQLDFFIQISLTIIFFFRFPSI